LTVEQGHVRAQVHAETATARAWIEAHQQDLRDGLSGQGLTLERLVVTTDGQRRQPQDDGARRQQRKSGRARAGEDVPRFELTA
jgi:flagellar hook-length control protein FliK